MAHSGTLTARTYTPRHQLASVTHDGNAVASFTYDPGMRETSRSLGSGAGVLTRTSTYNRQDNLVTELNVATRPGLGWDYTYDANKNLVSAATGGVMAGVGFTTTQDDENRLTGWNRTNGETSTWSLSDVGDWDSYTGQTFQAGLVAFNQQRTHNAVHELTQIDEGGTLTPIEHDAKGNITQDQFGNVYSYDFDNQLLYAKDSSGNVVGIYTYDALGRRYTRSAGGTTTAYVNLTDASGMGQVIAEYENGTLARHTTYGSYVDEPLSLHVESGTNAGSTYWYYTDRQYNVVGLTDASGAVVERYSYTPYGARRLLAADGSTVLAASAFGNVRGHQGLWHDDETMLIYNRARYRSVTLGRWMGRDPQMYVDGLNLYLFIRSTPFSGSDPSGEIFIIHRVMCWNLKINIRNQLSTREEKRAFNHFAGGSRSDFNITASQTRTAVSRAAGVKAKVKQLESDCAKAGASWKTKSDSVSGYASNPWKGVIGGFSLKIKSSCDKCKLRYTVKVKDRYDFDPKKWGSRSVSNELKTRAVRAAQVVGMCGWKEFYTIGEYAETVDCNGK